MLCSVGVLVMDLIHKGDLFPDVGVRLTIVGTKRPITGMRCVNFLAVLVHRMITASVFMDIRGVHAIQEDAAQW